MADQQEQTSGSGWGWLDGITDRIGKYANTYLDFKAADYLARNDIQTVSAERVPPQTSTSDLQGPPAEQGSNNLLWIGAGLAALVGVYLVVRH